MPKIPRRRSWLLSLLVRDYTTRVLLGLLGSLGIILVALHLPPVADFTPPGWYTRSPEWIPIGEVHRSEDSDEENVEEEISERNDDSPPPTRQGPPVEESHVDGTSGNGKDPSETNEEGHASSKSSREEVVSVTTLTGAGQKPEIVGGNSALYLHINYPYEARRQGVEGRLKLSFTVTPEGDVRSIHVDESLHPLCDSAAIRGIRAVRFRPAKRHGEPIPVRMSIPIRFELEKQDTLSFRTSRRSSGNKIEERSGVPK